MSGQIFISYRREDSSAWAGRLSDNLSIRFPSNQIFMDVDSVGLGEDFLKKIEETVGSCDVLIAVIGKGWLTSCDQEGQRRLDNPDDVVRIEIATALKRDILVIPVFVDGASMPQSRDLPDDLKALIRRNALQLSHGSFRTDSERLASAVERVLEKAAQNREREEKERLEAEHREREEKERSNALRRQSEEKERLEAERRKREEEERLGAEQREQKEPLEALIGATGKIPQQEQQPTAPVKTEPDRSAQITKATRPSPDSSKLQKQTNVRNPKNRRVPRSLRMLLRK